MSVTEEQKYRAYTYNIAGFALMTPLGKVILEYPILFEQMGSQRFLIYLLGTLLLFCWGLIFVEVGRNILYERRKSTYDY